MAIIKRYTLLTPEQLAEGIDSDWIEAAMTGNLDPWETVCLWQNCVDAQIMPALGEQPIARVAWLIRVNLVYAKGIVIEGVERKLQ